MPTGALQRLARQRQHPLAAVVPEQSAVPDLGEAIGQDMEGEAKDEVRDSVSGGVCHSAVAGVHMEEGEMMPNPIASVDAAIPGRLNAEPMTPGPDSLRTALCAYVHTFPMRIVPRLGAVDGGRSAARP